MRRSGGSLNGNSSSFHVQARLPAYDRNPMTTPGKPLSNNQHLIRWVKKMAALCQPARIHWVDGTKAENDALCALLVRNGTFIRLNQERWPGCYLARSDPSDVARVEDRTFSCSQS